MADTDSLACHGHSVLVVDDNDDTREAMASILGRAGFHVVAAWGGEDALRRFREGFRPCIAVVDLQMPSVSGWDLCERMHADAELSGIPVLIVSGNLDECTRAREQLCIREFITKPVDFDDLIAAVDRYCERHP
jgi:CheY-like chemotaxis protein